MDVVPETAAGSVDHDGQTYYFCAGIAWRSFARIRPAIWPATDQRHSHGAAGHAETSPSVPAGATYTCPMHPEIVRDGPGSCPICGMALEPMTVTADADVDPELLDMTRRFWVCVALTVPLLVLSMAAMIPGLAFPAFLTGRSLVWIRICPGGPGGLVGRPAVFQTGLGFTRPAGT